MCFSLKKDMPLQNFSLEPSLKKRVHDTVFNLSQSSLVLKKLYFDKLELELRANKVGMGLVCKNVCATYLVVINAWTKLNKRAAWTDKPAHSTVVSDGMKRLDRQTSLPIAF